MILVDFECWDDNADNALTAMLNKLPWAMVAGTERPSEAFR
jgi:hypothetical protein